MVDDVWPKQIIDREEFPWAYGRTLFEDGTVVPWMRMLDDAVGGHSTRYVDVNFFSITVDAEDRAVPKFIRSEKQWRYLHFSQNSCIDIVDNG
jgi:hypothetical protein